jgi:hypothetical protein
MVFQDRLLPARIPAASQTIVPLSGPEHLCSLRSVVRFGDGADLTAQGALKDQLTLLGVIKKLGMLPLISMNTFND